MNLEMNRMKVRDFATIGIYGVINIVIIFAFGLAGVPLYAFHIFAYVFSFGVVSLIQTPIYMLMAARVGKPGTVLIYNLIVMLMFVAMGALFFIPLFVIGGFIGELIMRGGEGYKSSNKIAVSWLISSITYGLHMPYAFYLFESSFKNILGMAMYDASSVYFSSPFWLSVLVISVIVLVGIGVSISKRFMEKHFRKSGII